MQGPLRSRRDKPEYANLAGFSTADPLGIAFTLRLSDRGLARLGKLGLVLFKTAAQLAFTARRVGAELCFGRAGVAQLTFA